MTSSGGNENVITSLNRHDVLLGRGSGPNQFCGNLKFRELVEEKREAYTSADLLEEKRRVAQSIVDNVHSRGGRFLRQLPGRKQKVDNLIINGEWTFVCNDVALEKAKQALREKPPSEGATAVASNKPTKTSSLKRSVETTVEAVTLPATVTSSAPSDAESDVTASVPTVSPPSMNAILSSKLPSMVAGGSIPVPAPTDARLLLFQSNPFAINQQHLLFQPNPVHPLLPPQFPQTYQNPFCFTTVPDQNTTSSRTLIQQEILRELQQSANVAAAVNTCQREHSLYSQFRDAFHLQSSASAVTPEPRPMSQADTGKQAHDVVMVEGETQQLDKDKKQEDIVDSSTASFQIREDDVAAFLLSSLAVSDRPVITDEQEAMERATLSDEEKAAILADAFGTYCSERSPETKKARKDLDPASIAFLVKLMRAEMKHIPAHKKPALLEAQERARAEEFSDARLEKFLRCEGMNTKLAAQRFVKYWEGRREVFGPEKFVMRMTLAEALRDDVVAIEAGMCCLLPQPDLHGRQVFYLEPRRHTREGYTSESMLRAIWYIFEIAVKENTDIRGGMVQISWVKNASLFDYDLKVYDRWAYFQSQAWPVRVIASHVCCAPRIITRVVKPIIHTFTDKRTRTRTIMHDVPEKDIVSVLGKYGIQKDILPKAMGGNLDLNEPEWTANRYAVELEEI